MTADRRVDHAVGDDGVARPDVLEIGLGLGVFAQQLVCVGVNSYTAVEPLEQVARLAAPWGEPTGGAHPGLGGVRLATLLPGHPVHGVLWPGALRVLLR